MRPAQPPGRGLGPSDPPLRRFPGVSDSRALSWSSRYTSRLVGLSTTSTEAEALSPPPEALTVAVPADPAVKVLPSIKPPEAVQVTVGTEAAM